MLLTYMHSTITTAYQIKLFESKALIIKAFMKILMVIIKTIFEISPISCNATLLAICEDASGTDLINLLFITIIPTLFHIIE